MSKTAIKPEIYVYTGTGNSLWVGQHLARRLGGELKPMAGPVFDTSGTAVLIFPVHIWGVPGRVLKWVDKLQLPSHTCFFAVAVNASQPSATLLQLRGILARRRYKLSAGFSLEMPSNYIPWGGPGSLESQKVKFREAEKKLETIADVIRMRQTAPMERGPWWQMLLFSALYKLTFSQVPKMDREFVVGERCNGCGICQEICPAENIHMVQKRPEWLHHCEQCLACLQWCPNTAIQYGKKAINYDRYHHPEITLKTMVCFNKTMKKRL